jgi:hypothetical protein
MEQSPSGVAAGPSAIQEIPRTLPSPIVLMNSLYNRQPSVPSCASSVPFLEDPF